MKLSKKLWCSLIMFVLIAQIPFNFAKAQDEQNVAEQTKISVTQEDLTSNQALTLEQIQADTNIILPQNLTLDDLREEILKSYHASTEHAIINKHDLVIRAMTERLINELGVDEEGHFADKTFTMKVVPNDLLEQNQSEVKIT